MTGKPGSPLSIQAGKKGMARAEPWGNTYGNCSLLRRSRVCRGKLRVSRRFHPPRRRRPPRTALSVAGHAHQRTTAFPPPASYPSAGPPATRPPPANATFLGKPSSCFPLHPSGQSAPLLAASSVGVWGSPWCSTPPPPLRESCRAFPSSPKPSAAQEASGQAQGPNFGLCHHPSLTGRALPPFLLPAGAAHGASGEPAGETRGPSTRARGTGTGVGWHTALRLRLRRSKCGRLPWLGPAGGEAVRPRGHCSGRKPAK